MYATGNLGSSAIKDSYISFWTRRARRTFDARPWLGFHKRKRSAADARDGEREEEESRDLDVWLEQYVGIKAGVAVSYHERHTRWRSVERKKGKMTTCDFYRPVSHPDPVGRLPDNSCSLTAVASRPTSPVTTSPIIRDIGFWIRNREL